MVKSAFTGSAASACTVPDDATPKEVAAFLRQHSGRCKSIRFRGQTLAIVSTSRHLATFVRINPTMRQFVALPWRER